MPIANEDVAHFFRRNGLKPDDIEACLAIVRDKHRTDCAIMPVDGQGGCSYTVIIKGTNTVVQFRLLHNALSKSIVKDVRKTFGVLVPKPLWFHELIIGDGVRLQACAMTMVNGTRFSDLQPRESTLSRRDAERLCGLVVDMASFFARSYYRGAEGPAKVDGKIGSSIRQRLVKLEKALPSNWMRSRARACRKAFDSRGLDRLPVVLNHGDLLPSNILVDQESWRLTGLVDWAEAEYLPFGMTLYGIEHLLGFMDDQRSFIYYDRVNETQNVFWERLRNEVPDLVNRDVWHVVMLSREIGVLLWHGIAWDEGRLDRVVDYETDGEEVAILETFLRPSLVSADSKL